MKQDSDVPIHHASLYLFCRAYNINMWKRNCEYISYFIVYYILPATCTSPCTQRIYLHTSAERNFDFE